MFRDYQCMNLQFVLEFRCNGFVGEARCSAFSASGKLRVCIFGLRELKSLWGRWVFGDFAARSMFWMTCEHSSVTRHPSTRKLEH